MTTLEPVVATQFPTLVITAANWTAEWKVDAHNSQFVTELLCMEAGTKAYEAFKGMKNGVEIVMMPDHKDEIPQIGTTFLCHVRGDSTDKAAIIFVHVCAASAGFYADSIKLEALLKKQIADITVSQAKAAQLAKTSKKNQADIAIFRELKDKSFPIKKCTNP